MRQLRTILVLLAIGSAAGAQLPKPAVPAKAPIADIPMDQMTTIVGRVGAIRAIPQTLTMRVGQTVQLDSIRVIAVDTKGHDIGRLRAFNFGIKPGEPATAVPRQITGARAGTTEIRLSYPSGPWGKRLQERPFTIVKIVVKS